MRMVLKNASISSRELSQNLIVGPVQGRNVFVKNKMSYRTRGKFSSYLFLFRRNATGEPLYLRAMCESRTCEAEWQQQNDTKS
jgi:hypothetical protein